VSGGHGPYKDCRATDDNDDDDDGKLIKQRLTFVKDVFRSFPQQLQMITG
jgi:hypothetical protein